MLFKKEKDRYFMASVRLGPKGQIVIPKEARDMFALAPGDTIVLLADKKRGIALQTFDALHPYLRKTFHDRMNSEEDEL